MKEGRESVGSGLFFTVGVAAAKLSLNWFYGHFYLTFPALAACLAGVVSAAVAARRAARGTKKNAVLQSVAATALMFLLAGASVCLLANLPEGTRAGLPGGGGALAMFSQRFRAMIDGVPFRHGVSNALMKALIAGDRSGLSWEVRASFRNAGASHLLALSGLHLSVIYLMFSKILSVAGNSPAAVRVRSALIILGSAFFTLMTGASASLVRAFLFIMLREMSVILRRPAGGLHIFFMSLTLQLALNPDDIASVGFQLSYLAMLGIYVVHPPLERLWDRAGAWRTAGRDEDADGGGADGARGWADGGSADGAKGGDREPKGGRPDGGRGRAFGAAMRKIWSLCSLSISCQAFTAPLVLLRFGTFPRYFLVTNLLCLPLSNALITLMVIVAVLHPLGLCPGFLLALTDLIVRALLFILDTIAEL